MTPDPKAVARASSPHALPGLNLAESNPLRCFFRAISDLPRITPSVEQQHLQNLDALRRQILQTAFGHLPAYPALRRHLHARGRDKPALARVITRFEQALPIGGDRSGANVDPERLTELVDALLEDDPNRTALVDLEKSVLQPLGASDLQPYRARCLNAFASYRRERDVFFSANIGLVIAVAGRYQRGHLGLLDFVQEGSMGLLRAIDRFDLRHAVRFSTYAVWWIRHAIGRALTDRGREIRLPSHLVERQHKLRRARAQLEATTAGAPSLEMLCSFTGLTPEQIEAVSSAELERKGLDELPLTPPEALVTNGSANATAPLPIEAELDQRAQMLRLENALEGLAGLDLDVIRRRFGLAGGEPMTLREIGQLHALSRERIRQIEARALGKLRARLERGPRPA